MDSDALAGKMLEDVTNYRGDVADSIRHLRETLGFVDAGCQTLSLQAIRRVTILFQSGVVGEHECREWARFILGRRDVQLPQDSQIEILELLEDWSFPDSSGPIDRNSIAVWQGRLDAIEFG